MITVLFYYITVRIQRVLESDTNDDLWYFHLLARKVEVLGALLLLSYVIVRKQIILY